MGFSDLPIEILYGIADYLGFERDINALVRTSKRSYSALNRYLYRHHVKEWDADKFESVCKSGLINSMCMFLSEGTSLDTCNHGFSSITVAAAYGNENIVKCLLEKGVDPNVKQVLSEPWVDLLPVSTACDIDSGPYDLAIENGHEGTVRLLVPHMKSVDYFTKDESRVLYGRTPLRLAVGGGNLNLVRMLVEELKCKVDPHLFLDDGSTTWREMTPLALAASLGHTDIARYLISCGADPNAVSGSSCLKVLAYAVEGNYLETAKALIEYGSIPDPLIEIQQARNMFWYEENQHIYTRTCRTIVIPLVNAAFRGNHEVLRLLFQYIDLERIHERGVHVEDADFLVLLAAACGLDSIVQRLLEKGCDVNTCVIRRFDPLQRTLNACNGLFFASRFGHIGVARILFDHGADPDSQGFRRTRNPLVEAVSAGQQQMAELLLDAGANPNTTDNLCKPVLLLAVQSEPMFRMLLNRGADPSTVKMNAEIRRLFLQQALESQDVSMTRLGLSIVGDRVSPKYITKLAAEAGYTAFKCTMQYLWHQHGVEPSPRREESYAALESAIRRQNAEAVEILLRRYGLRLPREMTADYLAWAASGRDRTRSESTLDVLLQRHDANVNASANADIINTTRSDGHTCLTLLIHEREIEGTKLVIDRGAKYPLTHIDPETGKYLLSAAMDRLNSVAGFHALESVLELLLQLLVDAQGIASASEVDVRPITCIIEPHLRQAQVNASILRTEGYLHDDFYYMDAIYHKWKRVRVKRLLDYFRCRRRYPVLHGAGDGVLDS